MQNKRLDNIDGLRAVAAISVVVQHILGDIIRMPSVSETSLAHWSVASVSTVDLGRFGVILFFLISGFVVPFSLRRPAPLRHFAISRAFRLYPAYWLAIIALAVQSMLLSAPVPSATFWANVTMAPSLFGQHWMLGTYWTLFIETQFYVTVALLFTFGALFRPRIIALIAGTLVASTVVPILCKSNGIGNVPVQYFGLHLSFLFSGLLLRLAFFEKVPGAAQGAVLILTAQLVSTVIISPFSLAHADGFALIGVIPIVLGYILAIVAFSAAIWTGLPRWAPLTAIGRVSYSLYLFHWFACQFVYAIVPLTGEWRDVLTLGSCVVASLILAFVMFHVAEKPAMAASKRLMGWLSDENPLSERRASPGAVAARLGSRRQ